ncbi:MAG: UMP kinase [Neomegalonema sp.]|nr:UMP kinase [Neomegalonema sp.]
MSVDQTDPPSGAEAPLYRRVLLKISGEALMGDQGYGLHPPTVTRVAARIAELRKTGVELALVVGGGNIFRGLSNSAAGMERSSADHMGMLATVMNALALEGALRAAGVAARTMSAIPMPTVCESFSAAGARRHLEAGVVTIFAAGTGNPYFTTDTAATLRALESGCDALWKATQVDGVYDSDPKTNPDAQRYAEVDYTEVLLKDLKVMDAAAIALARDNKLPVVVFALEAPEGFTPILYGRGRYTLVRPG